jgi:hypothetical protein
MMVVEGVSPDAFIAIDQHERRQMTDALKLRKKLVEEAKLFLLLLGGEQCQNPTIAMVGEICCEIAADSDYLADACNTTRAIYSSAAMRCAAILLMLEGRHKRQLIGAKYRDLVLHNSESWTKTMHAFARQVSNDKINTAIGRSRYDLFARGLLALDPSHSSHTRITIDDAAMKKARDRVSIVLGSRGMQAAA